MKRWALIAVAVFALAASFLYELSTYTLRGWWADEASFQGRPTSYWRANVEAWRDRFESPTEAERFLYANSPRSMIGSTIIIYKSPRPTLWTRARGWFGRAAEPSDNEPPAVLNGDPSAESVLAELEADPDLRLLVNISRPDGNVNLIEILGIDS